MLNVEFNQDEEPTEKIYQTQENGEETVGIFDDVTDEKSKKEYNNDEKVEKNRANRKKIFSICISILLVVCLVVAIIVYPDFSKTRKTVNAFNNLNDGQYSEAIAEFDELIAKDNKNIEAYAGKAMAQISSNDKSGAADTITTMVEAGLPEKPPETKSTNYYPTIPSTSGKNGSGSKSPTENSGEQNKSDSTKETSDTDNPTSTVSEPTQTENPGNEEQSFGRILSFLVNWIFRYNIVNDMADQNEILMEMMEQSGLNAMYNIYSRPAAPTADWPSGIYNKAIAVNLSSSADGTICYIIGEPITVNLYCLEGNTVRYRMEAGELNMGNSALYEQPIRIAKNHSTTNIVAAAYDTLYIPSEPLNLTYELDRKPLAAPESSHNSGEYTSKFSLSLKNPNDEGKIYYTTDGSEPTTTSKEYSGAISIVEGTTNIKAKVIDSENDISSETLSLNYTVKIPKPTPTPKKYYVSGIEFGRCEKCGGKYINPAHKNSVLCTNCGWYHKIHNVDNSGSYRDISSTEFYFMPDRDDKPYTDLPWNPNV